MIKFMRPAICNNQTGKYSHSQLYNPADSGVRVCVDSITCVGGPFTLVGYGGAMFPDASFPESRGLSIHQIADPSATGVNYSKAHARTFCGPAIDGGMWGYYLGSAEIKAPIVLEPGNSVVIRGLNMNIQTNPTFLWHEDPIA